MSKLYTIPSELMETINRWIAKFPADRKASAVIPVMTVIQDHEGYVSEPMMEAIAALLDMPKIAVFEVANFYSMFELEPTGKFRLNVCTNVSCMLSGSEGIVNHLRDTLGVDFGETTADGMFTLKHVECLGSCGTAPVMQVGKDYHEKLTNEKVDILLRSLRGETC